MELGRILREERERQGYSLDAIEEETKIRKLYISAIEEEDFGVLPPRVYATGFVKRYARLLKLDENEIVKEFQFLAYGGPEEDQVIMPISNDIKANKKTKLNFQDIKLGRLLVAMVFLALVIWAGNQLVAYITKPEANLPVPSPSSQVQQPADNQKTPAKQEEKPAAKAVVSITCTQRCWVQVFADGQEQFNTILAPGEEKVVEGKQSVSIKAGNAIGLEVMLNNKKMEPLGSYGEVVEYEFLSDGTTRRIR